MTARDPIDVRQRRTQERRQAIQLGGLGLLGWAMDPGAPMVASGPTAGRPAPAARCVLIYLAGGPSQFETFDPKPHAPTRIRGPWGAIATRLPGIHFGEMLPQLSHWAHRISLIRSLHHTNSLHQPWPMLTGNAQQRISLMSMAHALLGRSANAFPDFVSIGARLSVGAGTLGAAHEPLEIPDPFRAPEALSGWSLPSEVPADRLAAREQLRAGLETQRRLAYPPASLERLELLRQQARAMLESPSLRSAFDVTREGDATRERFGFNHFGQSCLLARRLLVSGTRLVQITWANREDGFAVGWDVHGDDQTGLVRMEQQLCPRFDQGLSAFLEDLDQHGLLESTLVVVTGEFGRTPQISRLGGRDHWPFCFSALLAGGGVPAGGVVGASDPNGAYPRDRPVAPADFAATVFHLLGVDANRDDRLRAAVLEGRPLKEFVS